MQSRRDLLYIKPWEERRYKDHRAKVHSALPAIDSAPPAPRPHVSSKLKKCQHEADRVRSVQRDNFALLQRLNKIMSGHRLENRWATPMPTFHHKVGVFFPVSSLERRLTARSTDDESELENNNVKCYACDRRKKSAASTGKINGVVGSKYQHYLPSLYL